MEYLLNLKNVSNLSTNIDSRQQITPEMKFTCDGVITKWIIGAQWNDNSGDFLYPELQVWRNIGNNIYQKINGTVIEITMTSLDKIYEYGDTHIPFQAGDILGVFVPQNSTFSISSEMVDSPLNFYLSTSTSRQESPYDMIDQQSTTRLMSQGFHPLVSVEFGDYKYITLQAIFILF